jgi:hypothetical protein
MNADFVTATELARNTHGINAAFAEAYEDVRGLEARIVELEAAAAALNDLIEANTKRIAELEANRAGERWYHDEE